MAELSISASDQGDAAAHDSGSFCAAYARTVKRGSGCCVATVLPGSQLLHPQQLPSAIDLPLTCDGSGPYRTAATATTPKGAVWHVERLVEM